MFNAAANVGKYETTGPGASPRDRTGSWRVGNRGRRTSVTDGKSGGGGGGGDDTNDEPEELYFHPRELPLSEATRGSLFVFVVFLVSFTWITVLERNDSVYYFAEHARQLVGVSAFRRLESERHTFREYQSWFTYHFVDGMANASTRLDPTSSIALVGPPRVRQVRFGQNCSIAEEMLQLVPTCGENYREEKAPFAEVYNRSGLVRYQHRSADQTGDYSHVGVMHLMYSGGGYLLPDIWKLLARPTSVHNAGGSELYPFSHWVADISDLWESGWIDKHTKAIFHDFTLYSAPLDLYANVRLTTEFEGNGGFMTTQVNLRVFWLDRPSSFMFVQYLFALFLLLLVGGELKELVEGWRAAEKTLVEECVELKYSLRLRKLQFAAQNGVPGLYQPQVVLRKLTRRLYMVDRQCTHHIAALNGIGEAVTKLQRHYEDSMRMLKASGIGTSHKIYVENPVVKWRLAKAEKRLEQLRATNVGCCGYIRRSYLRLAVAFKCYFQDEWNALDCINYTLLVTSFVLRLYSWSLMDGQREQVANIPRPDRTRPGYYPQYEDSAYVNFFLIGISFGASFYLNAFSAILTYLKLFKFLSVFPEMSIFTKTLSLSARHLGVFFIVVVVVLFGSAAGFCLAFGTDVDGFRNPYQSVVSIALFTIGRFNYEELVDSQRWMGPLLFWVYIFLVFFVLMSVFIAILAEGYEAAKGHIPATASRDIWEDMLTLLYRNAVEINGDMKRMFKCRQQTAPEHPSAKVAAVDVRKQAKTVRMFRSATHRYLEDGKATAQAEDEHRGRIRSIQDANIRDESGSDGEGSASASVQSISSDTSLRDTTVRLHKQRGAHAPRKQPENSEEREDQEPQAETEPGAAVEDRLDRVETQLTSLLAQSKARERSMTQQMQTLESLLRRVSEQLPADMPSGRPRTPVVAGPRASSHERAGSISASQSRSSRSTPSPPPTSLAPSEQRHHRPAVPSQAAPRIADTRDLHGAGAGSGGGGKLLQARSPDRQRCSVPSMRQQLAAAKQAARAKSLAAGRVNQHYRASAPVAKPPSLREQLVAHRAQSVERVRTADTVKAS